MLFFSLSFIVLVASAFLALAAGGSGSRARIIGAGGALLGSALGLIAVVKVLFLTGAETYAAWSAFAVPMGRLSLSLDPLSAFFLLPVYLLTAFAAVYGAEYLGAGGGRRAGAAWCCFNLLTASMALVFASANAVLFMLAWEAMAVSSFLLVAYDHHKEQARRAAWIYLVAGGAGALALLFLFSLLGASAETLDFPAFARPEGAAASAAFLAALLGFGLKAGVVPLHVWLPEAHPAAPSHVSAVMSGVMIKTGVYGLIRTMGWLAPWDGWWGPALLLAGLASGLVGVIFALAQHDLKRLLAYSSVENIGIILMGLGLGVTASYAGSTTVAGLCFGGALLHALNHSLFKGLLFMGAGAVMRATGTGELEALGGLSKKMPRTALYFLAGAAAISGLPPFNGFISEFLIFLGSFGALRGPEAPALWSVAVLLALAAIGGLAGACFARAYGAVFLGEPRSSRCRAAADCGTPMLAGLALPAAACLFIGLFPSSVAGPAAAAVSSAFGAAYGDAFLAAAALPLAYVSAGALALVALLALAAALRAFLLRGKVPAAGPTWDCGYAAPTARMQYGASSFAQPLTDFFRPLLRTAGRHAPPDGYFPRGSDFHTEAGAVFYNNFYAPAALMLRRAAYRFSWLQHGRLQFYILYIIAALLALLLWKL